MFFLGKKPNVHERIDFSQAARHSSQWTEYELFVRRHFPEHGHRISYNKIVARRIRVSYPLICFLIPFILVASSAFYAWLFKPVLIASAMGIHAPSYITQAPAWQGIGFGIMGSFLFLTLGVWVAVYKSRRLLFEGEQLTLQLRQLWLLEKISAQEDNPEEQWDGDTGPEMKSQPEFF